MKRKNVLLVFVFVAVSLLPFVFRANPLFAIDYIPLEPLPGAESASDLPSYISGIYKFALWAVGIAAMFMITIGGGMYLTSAGNTSAAGNAKNVITDAIIGLVLALVAWFLLNFINPDILSGDLSIFNTMGISSSDWKSPNSVQSKANNTNPTHTSECSNCVDFPSNIPKKTAAGGCGTQFFSGKDPAGNQVSYPNQSCKINQDILAKLQNVSIKTGWYITESYPPAVYHSSWCHYNGTCIDMNTSPQTTDVQTTLKLYNAFKDAGLNVLYESNNCAPYTAVGINCGQYATQTSAFSFHITQ